MLVARSQPDPTACTEQPLRMGPGQVGVEVDHLRFDPQSELHPPGPDVVDQRCQSLGPHLGRDIPVPQAAGVVPPAGEPPVVEDEPLDTDLGRPVGELTQLGQVMVEVDRLPGVQQHRPMPARVVRPGPHVVVEAGRQSVDALAVARERPGRRVRLPLLQDDLVLLQQLGAAQHPGTVVQPLGVDVLVAAPAEMDAPDLTPLEAEAGRSGHQHVRGVQARSPHPGLARPDADRERRPLRDPFHGVPTGEVEQLDGRRRYRQDHA